MWGPPATTSVLDVVCLGRAGHLVKALGFAGECRNSHNRRIKFAYEALQRVRRTPLATKVQDALFVPGILSPEKGREVHQT